MGIGTQLTDHCNRRADGADQHSIIFEFTSQHTQTSVQYVKGPAHPPPLFLCVGGGLRHYNQRPQVVILHPPAQQMEPGRHGRQVLEFL